jgi:RNA polymerase sigma-70 factor (ECF subfamily)
VTSRTTGVESRAAPPPEVAPDALSARPDANNSTSTDLSARALASDRAAWDELVRRHNPRVIALLVARGTRVDRAKEIAHDAWARLLEKQQAGELHELKLPALILQQAMFLAIDATRRAAREATPERAPDRPDPMPGMEDVLTSRAQLARAKAAFAECSPAEQRVFRVVYERPELKCREIAALLGLSEQRVKQITYEVRRRIRSALEEKR